MIRRGERFERRLALSFQQIAAFARAAGDDNPVHHDAGYAAGTRFGRPIASGTHTGGLLLGLAATHFSRHGAMLGLEFWLRFRRPVCAGDEVVLQWLVIDVEPSERLNGELVELRGRIRRVDGETAVGAKGRVLVTTHL